MAEESKIVNDEEVYIDSTDRGLFDFMKKKEKNPVEEEMIMSELENEHATKPEEAKVEEEKKEGIPEKLRRSSSTSSSSSSDEEEVDGEKKKKSKTLKEHLQDNISGEPKTEENGTSIPIEKHEGPNIPEEKKGMLEKIKEKLPGHHKNLEEVPPPVSVLEGTGDSEDKVEKKGIFEKIKEKLPGHHAKSEEEKEI